MNNIKEVHTKEAIMTSDNITEVDTQIQSTKRYLKSTEDIRRETPTPSQEAITLKSQVVPIGVFPGTYRTSQEHPHRKIPLGKYL